MKLYEYVLVPIERYGSEGFMPKHFWQCDYNRATLDPAVGGSCQSGSGSSFCAGLCGVVDIFEEEYVICQGIPEGKW